MAPRHYVTIAKGDDKLWYWNITAKNGRIVAQGEGYLRKGDIFYTLKSLFSVSNTIFTQVVAMEAEHRANRRKK